MTHPVFTPALLAGAILFTVSCLVQNAMFTWSSRSRNSGDPSYHRFAAWASNGIYFVTNALVTLYIIKYSSVWYLLMQGILYTVAASEGSVFMMKRLLKHETGKRKVGNQLAEADVVKLKKIIALYEATSPGVLDGQR